MQTTTLTSTQYRIDAEASRFTVQAFASGLAAVVAHCPTFSVRDFAGEVSLSAPGMDAASCRLAIRAASLEIMEDVKLQDKQAIENTMFHEVLHIQKFPEIVFESSQIVLTKILGSMHRVVTEGILSLHGVRARHAMTCQAVFGDDSIRIYGDCTLSQTDFGIAIASVAGGTLKLRNEVRFAFFLIARRETR